MLYQVHLAMSRIWTQNLGVIDTDCFQLPYDHDHRDSRKSVYKYLTLYMHNNVLLINV